MTLVLIRRPADSAKQVTFDVLMRRALLRATQIATEETAQLGYFPPPILIEIRRAGNGPRFEKDGQIEYLARNSGDLPGAVAILQDPPDSDGDLVRKIDADHECPVSMRGMEPIFSLRLPKFHVAYHRM
ncbi:hypothetical protein [Sulfuritalea hydrogenivorans]|jgi:hypothetical protein|uniref:Uncharacterized protein n=1 Tax=Sulfuritalea hydrogenivorans sk43H TaxID=1223802 RepID=W0SKG8_9PROT|nr:hypothetical protein [Sulfuritalea hydrogenivorans]BAO30328.1 hypothetical protein SUTH_02546 [Sulfuritalea hydrogenivorans sk43H]